ncbi:PAS domain S-box protein [Thiomicrorhabdus cannonii]|uniref:PAS domain S-box protein n=1 Tax=Thiomicrorhabdus cannonii TaxID=2748011 RepID=UPI0015BC06F1|nr:PAS domain S-box protein [Thiomicrorhabdus cannonii]
MKDPKLRNALLLQLVENAQDGIVVAEKEGHDTILIYVNPAFEKLTGYQADEVLYQDCRFLQGEDTAPESVKLIRHAIDEKQPVRSVLKNYRKDGSIFWNELSVTPYYDDVDGVTYYIGIQKDVTDQVLLQQALEKAEERIAALEAELKGAASN